MGKLYTERRVAGRIPDSIVEDVKSRTDIVEIISEYVPLKPSGKSFIGLCPFHDDSNPSLNVNPDMQIYKCFACGEGGNVYTFLMKHEKMEFQECDGCWFYPTCNGRLAGDDVGCETGEPWPHQEAE